MCPPWPDAIGCQITCREAKKHGESEEKKKRSQKTYLLVPFFASLYLMFLVLSGLFSCPFYGSCNWEAVLLTGFCFTCRSERTKEKAEKKP